MHGSFALLTMGPIWLMFIGLELVCLGGMLAIRKITEGRAYNPAFSSKIGIQLLIAIVMISANPLDRMQPSGVLGGSTFQEVVGGIAILYAICRLFVYDNPADKYHQLVVMPILIWLLGTTVPLLLWEGSVRTATVFMLLLLPIFAMLVVVDQMTGR